MLTCVHFARAIIARSLTMALVAAFTVGLVSLASSAAWSEPKDIRWGTGPVGSSGHKALVVLADLLNKEMPEVRITVLPYPGAVGTVKGFATGEMDGYYGSEVALKEFAADEGRFKGFKSHVKVQPVQSFWAYTLDVGLAIKASDLDSIKKWEDLSGKPVYTGPLPFDTRLHLENAMRAVGVKHIYKQVDLSTAGSQLNSGAIKGMLVYVAGGETPAPWIAEASLAVDWAPLNPSPEELAKLKAAGFAIEEVDPAKFHKKEPRFREGYTPALLLGLRSRHERLGRRDLQDADHHRTACRRTRQDRPELQADRRRQDGRFPEAGARVDLRSGANPSRPRQVSEGEESVGCQVGRPRRQGDDVRAIGDRYHEAGVEMRPPRLRKNSYGSAMTDMPPQSQYRPPLVLDCIYYAIAIGFALYMFYYYWTGANGETFLALGAIPITYVLFTLQALRANELYPELPFAANYVIAAAYSLFSIYCSYYMITNYVALGTRARGHVGSRLT